MVGGTFERWNFCVWHVRDGWEGGTSVTVAHVGVALLLGGGGNFVRGGYLWGGVDFDTCLVHVCGSSDYLAFNSKNHGVELGFFVCV